MDILRALRCRYPQKRNRTMLNEFQRSPFAFRILIEGIRLVVQNSLLE